MADCNVQLIYFLRITCILFLGLAFFVVFVKLIVRFDYGVLLVNMLDFELDLLFIYISIILKIHFLILLRLERFKASCFSSYARLKRVGGIEGGISCNL